MFCQPEPKVRNFFTAKEAFLKVDLNVVLYQPLQNVVERSDVFLVGRLVDEEVVNVNNYIGEAVYNCLHEALEAGWAAQ